MPVNKEEKLDPAPGVSIGATVPAVTPADKSRNSLAEFTQPQMSKGEKWYNRIVYSWLNYWTNLGISLFITDIFLHGGKLEPFKKSQIWWLKPTEIFKRSTTSFSKAFTSIGIPEKAAKRATEVAVGTFTLNSGGNLLLIPMKLLEDRKRAVVHWMNKHIFKDKQLAVDGHEMTPDEIYIEQEQPKQTWANVVKRRIIAISPTILAGLALDWGLRQKYDPPREINGKHVRELDGQKFLTGKIVEGLSYVPGLKSSMQNDTVKRYTGYFALDSIYTIITSKIMHMTNGAKKASMPKEIGDIAPAMTEGASNNIIAERKERSFADSVGQRSPAHRQILEKTRESSVSEKLIASRKAGDQNNIPLQPV